MTEMGVQRDRSRVTLAPETDRPTGRRRSDRIVGTSVATQEIIDRAMASAAADLPVHVLGPTGSGKEHIARAIHAWSNRSSGPLVVLAGAALAEPLVTRELYGCVQGLYPTLPEAYEGALSRAAGGTLLIDRFDRLPERVRTRIPEMLAEARFQREGDSRYTPLRARIIVSSIEPIEGSPFGGLPHHTLELRPLAERADDILPLAAHFLRMFAEEAGVEPVGFTADARNALTLESWPGNVRELAERIRQALHLAGKGAISAEALLLSTDVEEIPSFKEAKRAFETRYVVGLLRRCGGNISRAARLAKKDRKDFYDVIRRTGVDPSDFR